MMTAPRNPTDEEIVADTVSIPSRRVSDSVIRSKKPTERPIDPPKVSLENLPKPEPLKDTPEVKKSVPDPEAGKETEPDLPGSSDDDPVKVEEDPIAKTTVDPETGAPEPESAEAGDPPPVKNFSPGLTRTEKIGITVLVAILAIGAIFTVMHFSSRVPTRSVVGEDLDFPIEGKLVKVTALTTYWREPVIAGEERDVVRRGTKLIPVVKISAEANSASIRVLFRDEDGSVIGDPINRTVKGKASLRIPATAGFDDIGMHAAYRTGESPPWVVQILEASDSGQSIDNFTEILETEISTDIR